MITPHSNHILFLREIQHFSVPFARLDYVFITRSPKKRSRLNSNWTPFQWPVWLTLFISLMSMAMMFKISHTLYTSKSILRFNLVRKANVSNVDFALLTLCSLTEPNPLPWFAKLTAGGKLVQCLKLCRKYST